MSLKFGLLLTILITLSSVLSANFGPLFNDAVAEVNVVAGQTGILPCSAKHKGTYRIIWMNPKQILFSNEDKIVIDDPRVGVERTYDGDWNLVLKHVRYNDSGEYMCQINTKPVKIRRVFLYVQVPSYILNDESSRDMDVEEGDTVSLVCKATGVPQPNITWFRRSLVSTEGKDSPLSDLNEYGETLVVPDIQRYQSGLYSCLAYNNVPPAVTREMEIRVQYAPVVKLLNSRLGQMLGKETILECTVTSYPRAKITWIKNGVPIKHSYKYRLELYNGDTYETYTLTLQLLHINSNDFGDYSCEAFNRMGTDRSTMVLYEYREPTSRPTTSFPIAYFTTTEYEDDYYYWVGGDGMKEPTGDTYVVLADGEKTENIFKHRGNGQNGKHNYGVAVDMGFVNNRSLGVTMISDLTTTVACAVLYKMFTTL